MTDAETFLPAYPWDERPKDAPLTTSEVCAALHLSDGDVDHAAARLKVGALILRKFIERSARARATILETNHRLADRARRGLREALNSPDDRRKDWAIRYVLNSAMARSYGLSSVDDAAAHALDRPNLTLQIQPVVWGDGTVIVKPAPPPPTLELAPPDEADPAGPADVA